LLGVSNDCGIGVGASFLMIEIRSLLCVSFAALSGAVNAITCTMQDRTFLAMNLERGSNKLMGRRYYQSAIVISLERAGQAM